WNKNSVKFAALGVFRHALTKQNNRRESLRLVCATNESAHKKTARKPDGLRTACICNAVKHTLKSVCLSEWHYSATFRRDRELCSRTTDVATHV
ncbi:hypothetical protein, partial [Cohnella sp.]|uniref:hypothetical protein n=1 Tax=Cohnella sp. TaxID=1883426 RepID=UPI003704A981